MCLDRLEPARRGAAHSLRRGSGPVPSPACPGGTIFPWTGAGFELEPDFSFSPVSALTLLVGGNGSRTVTVNANATFNQTVALAGLGNPTGSVLSFSPTSVTPALGSSASSQLTLALGPSVPGTTRLPRPRLRRSNGTRRW